jgi:pimeloyl-ACP methyl ester carboxylesterase
VTVEIITDVLSIGYRTGGPEGGLPVMLLHGWPDDPSGWSGVTGPLEEAGYHWVAPWLRGFGATRFLSTDTVRDGTSVAIAHDALDLADALGWERFAVVGHDWGGRAAYVLAAIAPERVTSIAALAIGYAPRGEIAVPASFAQCRRWWYQWLMTTDGGAALVTADPIGFARIQWDTWSPEGWYDEEDFVATSASFQSPDWVPITLHGYRSRWQGEPLDLRYQRGRDIVAGIETVDVATFMIQGSADACDPPEESEELERYFTGRYERVVLDGVGHFPAREAPDEVARLILDHLHRTARL